MPVRKLVTRPELAQVLGVHMQTITKWERAGLPIAEQCRRGKPSLYSLADAEDWQRAREVEAPQHRHGGPDARASS